MTDKLMWAILGAVVSNKVSREWLTANLKKLSQVIDKEVDRQIKTRQPKKKEDKPNDEAL